ncbi:MAG: response regulator transcription factor, partial [Aquiluna sp.]
MTRVLVVEDEKNLREPLVYLLQKEGYDVIEAEDGNVALENFRSLGADLILLDLMLPGLSGNEVCRIIRAESQVPIIMVTAKDTEIDKVVGLEIGADDYVTKPYSTRELLARMKAVLRRGAEPQTPELGVLRAGPVEMDLERHTVSVNGEKIQMPLKEFELLELLMENVNRVLTRGQ